MVVTSIYLSNQFYKLNTSAGGLDAVLVIPGASELTGQSAVILSLSICLVYAIEVLGLLWFDKTETLGILLDGYGWTLLGCCLSDESDNLSASCSAVLVYFNIILF